MPRCVLAVESFAPKLLHSQAAAARLDGEGARADAGDAREMRRAGRREQRSKRQLAGNLQCKWQWNEVAERGVLCVNCLLTLMN